MFGVATGPAGQCHSKYPGILANKLISAVSGVRLHDFGCSLKAYRAEVLEGIRLYGEMHRFLPIYAKWHGAHREFRSITALLGSSKCGLERCSRC